MAVRITEQRARDLLKQCMWLLITCLGMFAIYMAFVVKADGNFDKLPAIAWQCFITYWLAGVLYFIWLGRQAHGLARSVVYYVGGTWLLTTVIYLFAQVIAYANIHGAVSKTFGPKLKATTS